MATEEYTTVFVKDRARPLHSTDLLTPTLGPDMIDETIRVCNRSGFNQERFGSLRLEVGMVGNTEVPTCRVCHQEFKGYSTLATHQSMENHWHGTGDGETGGTENDETDAEDSDLEDVSDVNFSDSECDWSEEVGDSDSDSDDESDEEKLDNAQNVNAMRDVTA
ncbi:Hypp5065 [Branchiostoma lanceolatum]|uniref:Hypp5065 protein n=1 Tax=Branchiostoma lanceolatum TaxID=7740 RepID=A0A8K0AD77_BRALA|nr:Hypp5065 [Branchiostoma lanceolatum]